MPEVAGVEALVVQPIEQVADALLRRFEAPTRVDQGKRGDALLGVALERRGEYVVDGCARIVGSLLLVENREIRHQLELERVTPEHPGRDAVQGVDQRSREIGEGATGALAERRIVETERLGEGSELATERERRRGRCLCELDESRLDALSELERCGAREGGRDDALRGDRFALAGEAECAAHVDVGQEVSLAGACARCDDRVAVEAGIRAAAHASSSSPASGAERGRRQISRPSHRTHCRAWLG